MIRGLILCAASLVSFGAFASDFSECDEYSRAFAKSKDKPVISEGGRRADWVIGDKTIGCRVDADGKMVALITPDREIPRADLVKVAGPNKGVVEHSVSDDRALTQKAERWFERVLKDPESAKFEDVYIAGGAMPAVCGHVNARNSHGGYTGHRRFYFTGTSELNEIEGIRADSVFLGMFERLCSSKRVGVQLKIAGDSGGPSIAEELDKLHSLLTRGVITKEEFERQKARLLN